MGKFEDASWLLLIELLTRNFSTQLTHITVVLKGVHAELSLGELVPPWKLLEDICLTRPSLEKMRFVRDTGKLRFMRLDETAVRLGLPRLAMRGLLRIDLTAQAS